MASYNVNQQYKIPCIFYQNEFIPVLLPKHVDSGIEHYHIDERFLHPKHRLLGRIDGDDTNFTILPSYNTNIYYRILTCYRENTLLQELVAYDHPILNRTIPTEDITTNGICPHKNYNLEKEKIINNCIVCPMHGLKICSKTKKVIGNAFV